MRFQSSLENVVLMAENLSLNATVCCFSCSWSEIQFQDLSSAASGLLQCNRGVLAGAWAAGGLRRSLGGSNVKDTGVKELIVLKVVYHNIIYKIVNL